MWEICLSGSVRGWGTTDVWPRYCGTTGKPGGNREHKHQPVASGVPSLLDKKVREVQTLARYRSAGTQVAHSRPRDAKLLSPKTHESSAPAGGMVFLLGELGDTGVSVMCALAFTNRSVTAEGALGS
jgi:hypothetical protein